MRQVIGMNIGIGLVLMIVRRIKMRTSTAILMLVLGLSGCASTSDLGPARFGGVGLMLRSTTGGLEVIGVASGLSADEAGLLPGDVINTIDGDNATTLSFREACSLLRGPTGSHVRISFTTGAGQTQKRATLERQTVDPANVKWEKTSAYSVGIQEIVVDRADIEKALKDTNDLKRQSTEEPAQGDRE